ncbi:uncharacterized protein LOC142343080 [Convolutriloba macropyga]|uniref:uncharacterized protein LOC142343080 n=1 Tax=Convolutriloba macropyga TaxID=536237 RepID=UPI003F51F0B4
MSETTPNSKSESLRGVGEYWVNVNHVAIVVSDVGTSLAFYTDVVGFQQIMRPDFDRPVSSKLKSWKKDSTKAVIEMRKLMDKQDLTDGPQEIKKPEWLIADDEATDEADSQDLVDHIKLRNLLKRRKTYGDITQNATAMQIERLLVMYKNEVPQVIGALESWVRTKKTQTYIPPAFYDRDGSFVQPPSFEMPLTDTPSPYVT